MKIKHTGQNIVVCTHGEPWLFAKQYFLWFDYDNPTERDSQYPAKDGYDEIVIDNNWKIMIIESFGKNTI